jgi:hypothetical protein
VADFTTPVGSNVDACVVLVGSGPWNQVSLDLKAWMAGKRSLYHWLPTTSLGTVPLGLHQGRLVLMCATSCKLQLQHAARTLVG